MKGPCSSCNKMLEKAPKRGLCQKCRVASRRKPDRFCLDCNKLLSTQNVLGRCRTCSLLAVAARLRETPEHMALLRANGRRNVALMHTPEAIAKSMPGRRAGAQRRSSNALAWCPPQYREEYRRHMRAGNKNAAVARRLIREKIQAERDCTPATWGNVNSAADHLRRLAPVFKREGHWLYGSTKLTDQELIQRALLRGWSPPRDRWAA